jgi:hypothetical protein
MKTTSLNKLIKNILLGALTTIMIFSFTACTRKIPFLTSLVVPAAKGYIIVRRDNNKNYVIRIHISNLAEATRLQPSKQTYVVWMVTDRQKTENIGQLNSSTSFLSKELKASFETVSSSKPTKIFISAENDGSIQYPGEQVVLSTNSF